MLYMFGDYELDTQLYELRHAGEPVKTPPQVFNVLAYLVEHRDRTISKQELLDSLWPEQFTSEAVLSYCIMTARKAVGDSGRAQRVIKTVHGRGFRFIAALQGHNREPPEIGAEAPLLSGVQVQAERQALAPDALPPDAVPLAAIPPVLSRPLDGKHQLASVLCVALANAIALSEQLGFNALQRIRQAFFALAQQEVQRHKGTLQFYGADGILVLFGMPVVCEDHASRAVLAATGLQRRLRERLVEIDVQQAVELSVRMGLHTGPVAVDSIPDDQRIAATEMGETMNLAVWLQYLAKPGTLLISEPTMQLVRGMTPCIIPKSLHVPGQPHPVMAYTVGEFAH